MAHNVSNEYKQVIYSGDARNKLKLLFNNVELQDADKYCEKLTIKSRIIPNGAKIFNLNNFISKEADLILHDIDTSIIQNQVSISIGTLVGNSYEYVPIGIFNIENQPTNDKNKTTIKLRDNSVKFDFNYNAQPLIEQNGGTATKLQILQDICSQAGVTCNITSFVGYLDEIGVYDNTITAREYISRIAEQTGRIATINRSGELIFLDLNSLTTWEIPIEVVEKYENGTKFKIGRVVYEDGIVRYETPTSNDDTLFLDGSNNYINGELTKEQASSSTNSYYLENTGEAQLAKFQLEGKTTQETRSGKNLLYVSPETKTIDSMTITKNEDGSITLNGTVSAYSYLNINLNYSDNTKNKFFTMENGQAYTLYVYGNMANLNCTVRTSSQNAQLVTTGLGNNIGTATYSGATDTQGYAYLGIARNVQFNNVTIKPMLVKGTYTAQTIGEWEYYGQMPSPDYPSELVSVGYENLFDINSVIMGDYTGQNATIRATTRQVLYLKKGSYTLKTDMNLSTYGIALAILPNVPPSSSYNALQDFGYITKQTTTFNVTSEGYAVFTFRKNGNLSFTLDEIKQFNYMFEKGTQTHSYIPYGKYGIEVKTTGKNLFTMGNFGTITNNDMSITSNNNSSIIINGSSSAIRNFWFNDISMDLTPGTYYFSLSETNNNVTYFLRQNGTNIVSTKINSSFTISQNTHIDQILIQITSGLSWSNKLVNIQLEKSTQATDYEEYKSNTYLYALDNPLRSIGDTKDLLYIKNGYLYIERKIGSILLNGTEDWEESATHIFRIPSVYPSDVALRTAPPFAYSNYFKYAYYSSNITTNIKNGELSWNGSKYLVLRNDNISNVATLKTWLSTHNVEVNYILATPIVEELGEVNLPSTYNNVTTIDLYSRINTNSYIQYRQPTTQLQAILNEVNELDIDSLKTGNILGNPAIDPYDLIQIHDKSRNLFSGMRTLGEHSTYKNGTLYCEQRETSKSNYIKVEQLQYNLSYNSTYANTRWYVEEFDENYNQIRSNSKFSPQTFTLGNDAVYFDIAFSFASNTPFPLTISNIQLEKGNKNTDYVPYKDETYTTLATSELVYNGVLINTFDTQIGEEAKEQNVFVNGEATFQKWARTNIDNIEASITLQAGQIDETNGRINETNLVIEKDGALLSVLANNSNIDIEYDGDTPISGEVREVTTTTGFKFNADGMTISDDSSNFYALHRNTGTYYYDGGIDPTKIVGQYTKDGSKQKDLALFGVYYYGMDEIDDTPMFVAELYTDENGEECVGHFYNRGD